MTLRRDLEEMQRVKVERALEERLNVLSTTPADGEWGSITGTLSDQADLQTALNLKASLPLQLENRTSDPGSPAVGQMWLRTDL